MTNEEMQKFKDALEAEKKTITSELEGIAVQDPENPDNWEVKNPDVNDREADPNRLADNREEAGINDNITETLQAQLKDVNDALAKIEAGTYGKCEVSGEDIEMDRLEANPAARTSKAHMND